MEILAQFRGLLTGVYSLYNRKIYQDIKESIPTSAPPGKIIKFVMPELKKAWELGDKYGRILMKDLNPNIPKQEMNLNTLVLEFLVKYKEAKKVRDFKLKNRIALLTALGVKDFSGDEQLKQIRGEFDNKIKSTISSMIIASGQLGYEPLQGMVK